MITAARVGRGHRPALRARIVGLAAASVLAACTASGGMAEEAAYAVARVTIYPGDIVTAAMLDERSLDAAAAARSGQGLATREQAVGKVTRRTLLPGRPISLNALRLPDVVRSGKSVRLVYVAGDLMITGQGIALQSGGVGDVISVQSSDSNVIVRGRAMPDGTVTMEE